MMQYFAINVRVLLLTASIQFEPCSLEKPTFTVQPAMADKYPQESVVFKCNATGFPKPQVTWFHNGEKVQASNVGRIQINSKNELIFTSLQSGDKGTVQCAATNDAGEAISKAILNVKSEYQGYDVVQ